MRESDNHLGSSGSAADSHQLVKAPDPATQAYEAAQKTYHADLDKYWSGVVASKKQHQTVNDFPPDYAGPPKPAGYDPPKSPSTLPTVNDMLSDWNKLAPLATARSHIPRLTIDEGSEDAFKHAYAHEALNVGAKYGLTRKQTEITVESIYNFEDAGTGTKDLLSSVPLRLTDPDNAQNEKARRSIHPGSTAIGYNQLLMATSMSFVDGSTAINDRLKELAKEQPARATAINYKGQLLADVQHTVHEKLSDFAKADPGEYIDGNGKFTESLYAAFSRSLVPTSNGMTGRQMTAAVQALNLDRDIGPVLQAQQLDDLFQHSLQSDFKNALQQKEPGHVDDYLPAAIELANLAGGKAADNMLKLQNANLPTVNFFDRGGYEGNPVTHKRSADELLQAIYNVMHPKPGANAPQGLINFKKAFSDQK
jgi:hypothetical protein